MITEKQAQAQGWHIVRGAYAGTTDDRADRWYIQHDSDTEVDRRGSGYRTKRDALDAIEEKEVAFAWQEVYARQEVAQRWSDVEQWGKA